jgi:spore maturation protein CgeB
MKNWLPDRREPSYRGEPRYLEFARHIVRNIEQNPDLRIMAAMKAEITRLLQDDSARRQIAANGLETVRARHTCRHRAEQLLEICEGLAQ